MNQNIEHYLRNGRYSGVASEARRLYLKAQRERKEREARLKSRAKENLADGFLMLVQAI